MQQETQPHLDRYIGGQCTISEGCSVVSVCVVEGIEEVRDIDGSVKLSNSGVPSGVHEEQGMLLSLVSYGRIF